MCDMVTPTEDCMSENRIVIECHSCKEEFTKLVPKEERKGTLLLSCPFCAVESKIEFDDSSLVTLFKSKSL